jgi:hypothetical protein
MNDSHSQAIDDTTQPERPERWDEAIVAEYIYDLLRAAV